METLLTDYSEYRKMLESEMNQKNLGGNQMVESAIPSVPTYSRDTQGGEDRILPLEDYMELYRTLPVSSMTSK